MCSVKLSEDLEYFLFPFEIGAFVFRNTHCNLLQQNDKANILGNHLACRAYYDKKALQERICHNSNGFNKDAFDLMAEIWRLKDKLPESIRPYSSTNNYKGNGLSYELTIYHIHKLGNTVEENHEIDALLNPAPITDILNEKRWGEIIECLAEYQPIGFDLCNYGSNSKIAATWAAAAVLEREKTDLIETVIKYEILLQCGWFFYDATIDNLEKGNFNGVELQRMKNISTEVDHNVNCGISVNMSTRSREARQLVYKTSGYEDIRDRCLRLLDNRISLEKAKHEKNQALYGILTEILLVAFTLFQIYEPIKNLVSGQLTQSDTIVFVVMILLLLASIILIVRRSR